MANIILPKDYLTERDIIPGSLSGGLLGKTLLTDISMLQSYFQAAQYQKIIWLYASRHNGIPPLDCLLTLLRGIGCSGKMYGVGRWTLVG